MSAREEVLNGLSEHACCFSEEDAKRMVDAFERSIAPVGRPGPGQEPLIHSGITDVLDGEHPLAHETVYCDGAACRATMLHAGNNENMTTWVEAHKGNYCLPCFTALDEADGVDAWSGP